MFNLKEDELKYLLSDVWNAFGVQAIEHAFHNVQLIFDAKIDKVSIEDYVIWRSQLSVVAEK
jgi:hypothetical protein